jgi:hypothetical protein
MARVRASNLKYGNIDTPRRTEYDKIRLSTNFFLQQIHGITLPE